MILKLPASGTQAQARIKLDDAQVEVRLGAGEAVAPDPRPVRGVPRHYHPKASRERI